MNFLAIDTSGKHLSVIACRGDRVVKRYLSDCALKHSVMLMEEIASALSEGGLTPRDCDFFAAVVGPGSFTGIRIGISTVKGLCFACKKPALGVTSFDCVAYSVKSPLLAISDAGRGEFYACGYDENRNIVKKPCILSPSEFPDLPLAAILPLQKDCLLADPCEGLYRAVLAKSHLAAPCAELSAMYLRKSSAEERR